MILFHIPKCGGVEGSALYPVSTHVKDSMEGASKNESGN